MRLGMLIIALTACASRDDHASHESLVGSPCRESTLPWGSTGVGLRAAVEDSRAWGPQSLAVAPTGDVLVLDAQNERVLRVRDGEVRALATGIARDAEDVAVGSDGAFAVWSALQARAWIFEPTGELIGDVAIDRAFRHVIGVSLEASRRVAIRTAYQETLSVGSPAAPIDLATSLRGKREGAFVLADGRGVAVKAGTSPQLLVVDNTPGRRSSVGASHPLPGRVDAAMLIGVAGSVACMRVEQLEPTAAVDVQRRAVCLEVESGRVVLDLALPKPGLYLPRQELALGGNRLAAIHAARDGLVVRTCEVGR
jgi:hypothetical protein